MPVWKTFTSCNLEGTPTKSLDHINEIVASAIIRELDLLTSISQNDAGRWVTIEVIFGFY